MKLPKDLQAAFEPAPETTEAPSPEMLPAAYAARLREAIAAVERDPEDGLLRDAFWHRFAQGATSALDTLEADYDEVFPERRRTDKTPLARLGAEMREEGLSVADPTFWELWEEVLEIASYSYLAQITPDVLLLAVRLAEELEHQAIIAEPEDGEN